MANVEYRLEEATPQKKNRINTVFIATLAVLVLVAGGTLAYLTTFTNTEENMFIAGNIKAELIEAAWTPADPPDGTSGSEIAEKMLPGVVAPKDPLIQNTSDFDIEEWTGMVVKFQKPTSVTDGVPDGWTNMTDEEVDALLIGVRAQTGNDPITAGGFAPHANWGARIDTTTSVDALIPGQWVYAYNAKIGIEDPLDPTQIFQTTAIFDEVAIVAAAGSDEWDGDLSNVTIDNFITWLNADTADDGLGGHFQIVVQGAAVQGDAPAAEAKESILKLFGYDLPTP